MMPPRVTRIRCKGAEAQPRARHFGGIRAYAFAPAMAPAEIQLWNAGPNATDYGVHFWTPRSVELVTAAYAKRGNPLQIDVEHNGAEAGSVGPSGGYAELEIRNGAPWLRFDWSAYAIQQIESKERRFLSPEYDVDVDTGEIVALYRVSLVADPGTHNARMLARAIRRVFTERNDPVNLALILAALKGALAADDPEVAKTQIANLLAELEKLAGTGDGAAPPPDGTPAAAGAPPTPPADDPTKKRPPMAASSATSASSSSSTPATVQASTAATTPATTAAPPARIAASADPVKVVAELATEVESLKAKAAERDERERTERITARNARLPESLRTFAPEDDTAFAAFCAEEHVAAAIAAHERANTARSGGVKASASPTRGANAGGAGGNPPEVTRVLAQAFGSTARPEKSYEVLPDGRLRLTHLSRPVAARRV